MKPYAWVSLPENEIQILPFPDDGKTLVAGDGFYLYTHPVKKLKQIKGVNYYVDEPTVKALTDEEIMNVCFSDGIYDCINDPYMKSNGQYSLDGDLLKFAKAILRKAQEK